MVAWSKTASQAIQCTNWTSPNLGIRAIQYGPILKVKMIIDPLLTLLLPLYNTILDLSSTVEH